MSRQLILLEKTQTTTNIITTDYTAAFEINGVQILGVECVVDVNTPAAKTFTAANATEIFTAADHGFVTGLKCQVSNSGGALPAGLSAVTDYFVIYVSASTFKLATSLADAQAGTNLLITTDGTGTQTITSVALAGANVKLQKSNDGTNWVDEGSATNITADANIALEKIDPAFKFYRVAYTLTAGMISASNLIVGKGLD